jgi:hypothetical protein
MRRSLRGVEWRCRSRDLGGVPGQHDGDQASEGRAFVYHGRASGLDPVAAWMAEGDQEGALFGASVGTTGDANGDGYSDVIIGAPHCDSPETNEGLAFVYHGSSSGLLMTPNWMAESN